MGNGGGGRWGSACKGGTSSRGQERAQHGGPSRDNGVASVSSSQHWGHRKPPDQTGGAEPLCSGRVPRGHDSRWRVETKDSQARGSLKKPYRSMRQQLVHAPAAAPSQVGVFFTHPQSLIKQIIGGHRMTHSLRALSYLPAPPSSPTPT